MDKIGLIHQGRLIFFGPPRLLNSYFKENNTENIFKKLDEYSGSALEKQFKQSEAYKEFVQKPLNNNEFFTNTKKRIRHF